MSPPTLIEHLFQLLSTKRFIQLQNEKLLQKEIESFFESKGISFKREVRVDDINIFDFYIDGIVIEVKIKGNRRAIYDQCERYSLLSECKEIILLTNTSMGFPKELNGKPCYYINLGRAWL